MADNVTLNAGTGGAVVRTLDRSGVETQVAQLDIGGADEEKLVDAFNPVPVALAVGEMLGQQVAAQSLPVVMATEQTDAQIGGYGMAGAIAINTVIGVLDCKKARSLSLQVVSIGTSGTVALQWSNDGANWSSGYLVGGTNQTTVASVNAANTGIWTSPVLARYARLYFSAGPTAGVTALAWSLFPQLIGPQPVAALGASQTGINVAQATAANLNATVNVSQMGGTAVSTTVAAGGTVQPGNSYPLVYPVGGGYLNDATPGATTASGNSGIINDALQGAISAAITISAVSGTSPTLDLALQESPDGGITWIDVYHYERITANGTYYQPTVMLNGRRRWAWIVGGSTPSFTINISSNRGTLNSYPLVRQFFDRTAGLLSGTLNATSGTYQIAGCKTLSAAVTIGAATTPGTYKLQGSMDNGANWFDLSAGVAAVANSTVIINATAGFSCRHARVICSSAATGQTGTVVAISGTN